MAQAIPLVFGVVGAFVGSVVPGLGTAAGWAIGSAVGSLVEATFFAPDVPSTSLSDLHVQSSSWGAGLPQVFGTQRVPGNIIWSTDKILTGGSQGKGKGGGGGGGGGKGKKGTGSQGYYTVGIAFALAEGPIGGIKRIWAGGDLIFDDGQPVYTPSMNSNNPRGGYQTFTTNNQPLTSTGGSALGNWTLYHGTNQQLADPTIVANGSGNGSDGIPYQKVTLQNGFEYTYGAPAYGKLGTACAYRGIAYIVFDQLNTGYGGTIPMLTFEVVGQTGTLDAPTVLTPVYSPIPASLINQAVANYCHNAALIDDQTLCIPTGQNVCYCSTTGQLKDYSNTSTWPQITGNYVHTVVNLNSSQSMWANYDNGYRGIRSNLPWVAQSTTGVFNPPGNPTGTDSGESIPVIISGNLWGIDNYSGCMWTSSLFYNGNSYKGCYSFTSSLVNFSLGGCAIGAFAYLYGAGSTTKATITFQASNQSFISYTLPLVGSATIAEIFTDGISLYVVDTNKLLYKFSVDSSGNPSTLVSTTQLNTSYSSSGYFWANGWLYAYSNQGGSPTYLWKFNADGTLRYSTLLPNAITQHFTTNNGIVFLNGNEGGTTGATYFLMSYGDTTLTPTAPTLPQVIQSICARANFSPVDVSLVPSLPVNLTRKAGTSARDILRVLSQTYQMDMVDSAGTLRFVPKGQAIAGQLSYDDIGYAKPAASGGMPAAPYIWSRAQGTDLPRSIALKYTSALANFNTSSQFFQIHYDYGKDVSISLPLTLDDHTALTVAMLLCVQPHIEKTGYSWTCAFNQLKYEPGDVLQMPWGVTRITQVSMRQIDTEPVLDFQGVIDASYVINGGYGNATGVPLPQIGQPTVYQAALPTASSGSLIVSTLQPSSVPGQVPSKPPISLGTAYASYFEVPPLTSQQNVPFYVVEPWTTGSTFAGAAIYESTDGGTTFTELVQQGVPGIVGWTQTLLAATQQYTWDTISTVSVYLNATYMQLSGATDLQVIQGANLALIGSELIQFGSAVLQTDAQGNPYYLLSRLLRGRRGTESQMGTHQAGETFSLIGSNDKTEIDYSLHDLNNANEFKVATVGQNISAINATTFAPTGLWFKPFSVSHLVAAVDTSSNWNVSFTPRARLNGWWGSGYSPTLDTDTQTYSVDILNGSTIKRTLTGSLSTPSFQYTAAMQSADGFTPGQHGIIFNVYQVGQLGRGYLSTVTS